MTLMFSPPSQDDADEQVTKATNTKASIVDETSNEDESEGKPHKIKIIASLLIVGVATYLAYWAQTPDVSHTSANWTF